MKLQSFENLNVWQNAIQLAVDVYKASDKFPKNEQFALTNQIRRCAASVSANIAEGFGRQTKKEKIQSYSVAYGSLLELKSLLYLAEKLQYIDKNLLAELIQKIIVVQKLLNALNRSIRQS